MLSNKARDTKLELAVRQALHAAGFRYRVDVRPSLELRTRADIVFSRQKIAVFIDGCFWHGCPVHATRPKRNSDYWVPKLQRYVERDLETTSRLEALGWACCNSGNTKKWEPPWRPSPRRGERGPSSCCNPAAVAPGPYGVAP